MGTTLLKVKAKLKLDKDLRKFLVRGGRNEILLDVDGDKIADVALIDDNHDGDIDTIAVDLTGDGEFNLYFVDTDGNMVPDSVLYDENGDGAFKVLGSGKEVEDTLFEAARQLFMLVVTEDDVAGRLEVALTELDRLVQEARKKLNIAEK